MPVATMNGEPILGFTAPVTYNKYPSCNLDELTTAGIYTIEAKSGETKHESFPAGTGVTATIIVAKNPANNLTYQHFIDMASGRTFARIGLASGWRDWVAKGALDMPSGYVYDQTADLDTFLTDGVYRFQVVSGAGDISGTFPNQKSCGGILIVATTDYPTASVRNTYQVFVSYTNSGTYTRFYRSSSGFSDWVANSGLNAPIAYTVNQGANLDEITDVGAYTFETQNSSTTPMHESFPSIRGVGTLFVTKNEAKSITYQTFVESETGRLYSRIKVGSAWRVWHTDTQKQIRILFIGNSLTQDGIAYVPWLIRHYFPHIDFKFYMWYNGGRTLAQQYEYFTNDTPCQIFSVAENQNNWTNYNDSMTMSEILSTYEFDIVCMQEYYNPGEQPLQSWNDCKEYIRSHYCSEYKMLEFVSLFHAPRRDAADAIYQRTKEGNANILRSCIADDMIPNGMAVYRALSTDLDSLGDQGHLSPDGTHTQEGLPCLLQSWVTMLWILDRLGMPKSIYGTTWKMSTSVYNTIHVPGANLGSGVIAGTDQQNILAQEVAIRAFKEGRKFVNDNLWAD